MSVADESLGEIRRTGDTVEVVFRRRYTQPVETIWAALTEPERIAQWFAPTEIEGEALRVSFPGHGTVEGRIVEKRPMCTLAWTWPNDDGSDSVVRFELAPEGDGCRLVLTQSGLPAAQGADNAGGWHAHLAGLPDAAEGVSTRWERIVEIARAVDATYKARAPA